MISVRQWPVNSSWEAVRHLAERRGDLSTERLPVDHELAAAAVRALIWLDLDKRREGERNCSLLPSPGVLEAFNETFAAPR